MSGHGRGRPALVGAAVVALVGLLAACGQPGQGRVTPSPSSTGPHEVILSPPPPVTASPSAASAEWVANLKPHHQVFVLHRTVALVNMLTGRVVAQVGPDTISVDYETSAGGRAYWMTAYSVGRGLPNGMAQDDVAAAVAATPTTGQVLPPSLAGAEWTRLPTTDHVVALTFDAGGNDAGMTSILSTLAQQDVPATFFMTGRWAETYPAEARQVAASYPVGNHTYSHPYLTQLTDDQVSDQVAKGEAAIVTVTGHDPQPLFRFPFGDSDAKTLAIVHGLGYGGVRWTVDTWGWKGTSAGQSTDTVVSRVLAGLTPGAIVLMHVGAATDGSTLDANALPDVIAELRARGYTTVAVTSYI